MVQTAFPTVLILVAFAASTIATPIRIESRGQADDTSAVEARRFNNGRAGALASSIGATASVASVALTVSPNLLTSIKNYFSHPAPTPPPSPPAPESEHKSRGVDGGLQARRFSNGRAGATASSVGAAASIAGLSLALNPGIVNSTIAMFHSMADRVTGKHRDGDVAARGLLEVIIARDELLDTRSSPSFLDGRDVDASELEIRDASTELLERDDYGSEILNSRDVEELVDLRSFDSENLSSRDVDLD